MVGTKHINKLAAKERKNLLKRCGLARPNEIECEDVDLVAGPSTSVAVKQDEFLMEAFAKPEFHFDLTQGSPPNDQVGELTKRVQALEKKLEANTKTLEANTRQLAESTHQVSKLAALLQFFHKGKKKKVAVDVAFPVSSDEDLLDLDLKISLGSKGDYIQAITTLLERNNLPKAIQSVLTEQLLCEYNIDGVNGKKALKTFPEFFSVLIDSISSLEDQQPAEKALAHALSCVRNNANKKNYKK